MRTTKIDNHIEEARARLIGQYKNKSKLEGFIESLVKQIKDLEDAGHNLYGLLDIDNSIGTQLDKIGEIVGQPRQGLTDSEYRIFLNAKIGINISQGEIPRVIDIWKLITNAHIVHLMEMFPASLALESSNEVPGELLEIAYEMISKIVGVGIKVDHLTTFSEENAFAFAGSSVGNAGGFGDLNDLEAGGKFASLQYQD